MGKLGLINLGAVLLLVWNSLRQKDYLYFPAMVHLYTSPGSKVVLGSGLVWVLLVVARCLQFLLIGEHLRVIELTHLREYGWMTISEFLLSMTTFRYFYLF